MTNQRDKSPCCSQIMRVVSSESYVVCLEYNIDYKTGRLIGVLNEMADFIDEKYKR